MFSSKLDFSVIWQPNRAICNSLISFSLCALYEYNISITDSISTKRFYLCAVGESMLETLRSLGVCCLPCAFEKTCEILVYQRDNYLCFTVIYFFFYSKLKNDRREIKSRRVFVQETPIFFCQDRSSGIFKFCIL